MAGLLAIVALAFYFVNLVSKKNDKTQISVSLPLEKKKSTKADMLHVCGTKRNKQK